MSSHFVAVQLRGQEVQKKIRETLKEFEKNIPDDMDKLVIDSSLSHMTLFAVDIKPEYESEAFTAYNNAVGEFSEQHPNEIALRIKNIKCKDVRGHSLLYADVIDESGLLGELTLLLKNAMANVEGVDVVKYEAKAFLQMTLATNRIGDLGPRVFNNTANKELEKKDFGVQKVDAVQCLRVRTHKNKDKYKFIQVKHVFNHSRMSNEYPYMGITSWNKH